MDHKLLLSRKAPMATRREKYNKLRSIHYSTINDPYTRSTEVIRTTRNVQKIIAHMNKELSELSQLPQHPNQLLTSKELETIKICSQIFSKIIQDSSVTFKDDLMKIKRFYDNQLDELLRSMKDVGSKPHPSLIDRSVEDTQVNVLKLKEQLITESKEKQRLQSELRAYQYGNDTPVTNNDTKQDTISDYATRVDTKQQKIFQRHEEIYESLKSREGVVPYTVCQRLEQCICSSELEIQKLAKINKQLQKEIQSLEVRLRQYLEAVQTPPNHVMMLWKKFEKKAENYTIGTESAIA